MSLPEAIAEVLGGSKVLKTAIRTMDDFTQLIRTGIPVKSVDVMMHTAGLSKEELLVPIGISKATFDRRKQQARFEARESDRLFRLAYVLARATEVFGARKKAVHWLHNPNRALRSETPLMRLDTEVGFQEVNTILGRIEHGVYS
jgi:putative toxin-antitoxin system antitoxin component (TIGR02293 family)